MKIMRQSLFNSEGDIRAWLRGRFPLRLFWLEPSAGSTFGFPDCMLSVGEGQVVFFELKLAELKEGELRFRVRREQRITIARMRDQGVNVLFLVALKGEGGLWLVEPTDDTLDGGKVEQRRARVLDRTQAPTALLKFLQSGVFARKARG